MTARTPRRGPLVVALAAAVAVLLGSFVAVAAMTGATGGGWRFDHPGTGPGTSQFWHDGGRGPGMMGQDRRVDRSDRWSDRLDRPGQ